MIISLLIAVGLVVAVVMGLRRVLGTGGTTGGGGHAVRRFFQYLLLYGLLVVTALGMSGLLGRLFGGGELVSFGQTELARSLTFVLIGGPLYAGVALWSRRGMAADPSEAQSFGWAFYITIASMTALVTAMVAFHSVLSWVVGLDRYDGNDLAGLVVWASIWAAHWGVDRRVTPPALSQVHVLAGSLAGLIASYIGLSGLLAATLDTLFGTVRNVLLPGMSGLLSSAATLVAGAPVWVVYWLVTARKAERTPLWLTYVFLLGVAGGLVSALGAAATLIHQGLVWVLGDPRTTDAARYFSEAPDLVGVMVVGIMVWWYHRSLVSEAPGIRSEVRRVYEYVVAGIGLLAAAVGLATLLVAFLEALSGTEGVVVEASARNTLLGALTALLVGGPVWWILWRRIQAAAPQTERASPTRRVYLFVLFGVGGVAAVIALITAVFILFEDILAGTVGAETIRSTRFAVGVLVATGAVAAYHWAVYRQDRDHLPPLRPTGPRYVLLVGAPDDRITREVAHRTGGRVQAWPRTDGGGGTWSVEEVMDALAATSDEEVVVVADGAGLAVIPVHRN